MLRNDPLRIALVTDTHVPSTNGVVRAIETSRVGLRAWGAHVTVFAPGTRSMDAPADADVRRFASVETSIYPDLHLSVLPLLPRHLRGFDVVHVHTPGPLGLAGILSARRAGVPAVYTYHTRFDDAIPHLARTQTAERLLTRAVERIERSLVWRAAAVIAPTPALAREIEARLGVRPEVVPSGVDTERFRPLVRTGGRAPTFVHVGRLAREKGVASLLDAFALVLRHLPDARLRIGGLGPDAARLRAHADALGIASAIEWLGFVPEADLPRVYSEGDVFVTASRFETQGLTTLEALACGTPAALADVPVFEPIADAGAAVLGVPDDADAFARAMLRAFDERAALAPHALRFAQRHSTAACARRLYGLYARLAGAREAPSPSARHDQPPTLLRKVS